jgi:hypothetical protein
MGRCHRCLADVSFHRQHNDRNERGQTVNHEQFVASTVKAVHETNTPVEKQDRAWLDAFIEDSWQEHYADYIGAEMMSDLSYYPGLYRFRHDVMFGLSIYLTEGGTL